MGFTSRGVGRESADQWLRLHDTDSGLRPHTLLGVVALRPTHKFWILIDVANDFAFKHILVDWIPLACAEAFLLPCMATSALLTNVPS